MGGRLPLIALGALHATRHPPVRAGELSPESDRSRLALLMPYGPVAIVLGMSAVGALMQDPIIVGDVVFWLGAAIITLLLIRQGVVILENLRLARSLETTNERLQYQVLHDVLTGLPNRPLFLDRMRVALARLQRVEETVAVMFLDLDRFKPVNDTFGHEAGDVVLTETARRLSEAVRSGDTVARFGGDEFLVLCEDVGDLESVIDLADRIRHPVSERIPLPDPSADLSVSVSVGLSIGLVLVDRPGIDAETLVSRADSAMYRAKRNGGGRTEVVDDRRRPEPSHPASVPSPLTPAGPEADGVRVRRRYPRGTQLGQKAGRRPGEGPGGAGRRVVELGQHLVGVGAHGAARPADVARGGRQAGDEALHRDAVDLDDRPAGGEVGSTARSAMVITGAAAAWAASNSASTSSRSRAPIQLGHGRVDLVAVVHPAGEGAEAARRRRRR